MTTASARFPLVSPVGELDIGQGHILFGVNMIDVLLESVLVCPVCGFAKRETMPTDACQIFYECVSCKTVLRPKPGDCCVFCSYGSVKCPPMQGENCNNCEAE